MGGWPLALKSMIYVSVQEKWRSVGRHKQPACRLPTEIVGQRLTSTISLHPVTQSVSQDVATMTWIHNLQGCETFHCIIRFRNLKKSPEVPSAKTEGAWFILWHSLCLSNLSIFLAWHELTINANDSVQENNIYIK